MNLLIGGVGGGGGFYSMLKKMLFGFMAGRAG
jgi:hypothetical protein